MHYCIHTTHNMSVYKRIFPEFPTIPKILDFQICGISGYTEIHDFWNSVCCEILELDMFVGRYIQVVCIYACLHLEIWNSIKTVNYVCVTII